MRIAVVGLGSAGREIHLPALRRCGKHDVVACDPDPGRRAAVRGLAGVRVAEDLNGVLHAHRPEVVVVGTPPHTHAGYCEQSLAAGAHVICEKPFTSSVADADALVRAAARAGRQIALNHQFSRMPIFRELCRAVRDPAAGTLRFVQAWQLMHQPPDAEGGWRSRMQHRVLYEAGVHVVDLILALFGERPEAVRATMSSAGRSGVACDVVVVATLEFSSGRLARIVQSRVCPGPRQYLEIRADTDRFALRASFGGRARLAAGMLRTARPSARFEFGASGIAWRENGARRKVIARNPRNPLVKATRTVFAQALSAFQRGAPPPTPAETGRDVLRVIAACYRSAESGRRVILDRDTAWIDTLQMADLVPE